ncbi:MAG: hypothetical protein K0R50_724 [Eubacterium sp.]|nr:hypothetical protein [Eubacterium sp.]
MPEYIRNDEWKDINLEYVGENNFASFFSSEGNLHTYPAKIVPEMANSLLLKLKDVYKVNSVLDPFLGSGTIALEAKYLGLDFYGSDLNPLAVLLSQTKAMTINNTLYVKKRILQFTDELIQNYAKNTPIILANFQNIDYWFKEENIKQLSFLKYHINKFIKQATKYKKEFALILLTAFSSTIRASSLSRNGEFKLYRMSKNDIEKFSINSIEEFKKRSFNLLKMLVCANDTYKRETKSEIYLENAKELAFMRDRKVDLIFTSPPYGDSRSTVAYGEFSKLSLQWMSDLLYKYLNIETKYDNCDEYLLGGKHSIPDICNLNECRMPQNSKSLNKLFLDIKAHALKEVMELQQEVKQLNDIQNKLDSEGTFAISIFEKESVLANLLKSNARLYYLKQIKENADIKEKDAKKQASEKTEEFITSLEFTEMTNNASINLLKQIVERTNKALTKKIAALPKRISEIEKFFIDLYKVVLKTDEVINENGIQVWIVGHRTVLGSIEVNLVDILHEWFYDLNYDKLAIIKRNYHYKRLPHHINSTFERNKEVSTMNEEHILIVQKIKS